MLTRTAQALVRGIKTTEGVFGAIAMGMFVVLMLAGAFDVIGRYVFNRPIMGTRELSQVLIVGVVMLSWAHTQASGAHIRVELLVARLRPRAQAIIDFSTNLLALALFSLITWQATVLAMECLRTHRYITHIHIPVAAVQLFIPVGAFLISLELIIQIIHLLPEMGRKVD